METLQRISRKNAGAERLPNATHLGWGANRR
jgi:hypothetical protein